MHSFLSVNSSFFPGASDGNESDCASNPYVYAAAFANQFGPTDLGTVKCLFTLAFSSDSGKTKENEILYLGLPVGYIIGIFGAVLVVWVCWRRHKKCRERKEIDPMERDLVSGIEMINGNNSVIKFTLEEIKKATKNFS